MFPPLKGRVLDTDQVGGTLHHRGPFLVEWRADGVGGHLSHTPRSIPSNSSRMNLENGGDGVAPDILVHAILRSKLNHMNRKAYRKTRG